MRRTSFSPADPRVRWDGAVSVVHEDGVAAAFRLPATARGVVDPVLEEKAWMPAGVRLRFRTDARSIALRSPDRIGAAGCDLPPVDLVIDGSVRSGAADADGLVAFDDLGGGDRDVELWLPQYSRFGVAEILLDPGASLSAAAETRRPRFVAYGSSITQCRRAASPTQTWPAIVARRLGWDLTCLGFGGECHLDPEAAEAIVSADPDTVIVCGGVNVHSTGSYSRRTLGPAVRGFVAAVRRGAPRAEVIVCSPLASPSREDVAGPAGMTLDEVRREVRTAAEASSRRDPAVSYVDGRSILSASDAHLLADGLHPDADGYRLMGERWAARLSGERPSAAGAA